MKFEIRYKKGDDRQAINDMINYIGLRRSKILAKEVKRGVSFEYFSFCAGFCGVQGAPVLRFYEYFTTKLDTRT